MLVVVGISFNLIIVRVDRGVDVGGTYAEPTVVGTPPEASAAARCEARTVSPAVPQFVMVESRFESSMVSGCCDCEQPSV